MPSLDLKRLLPAIYRIEDDEVGGELQALLDVLTIQGDGMKANIDQLWDDFFIDTCAQWVIPYIGDLVGNRPLHGVALRQRADVANTIHYRRRKGTLPMLEQMGAAVTGWSVHAVAAFELLNWTQNLNHLRMALAPIRQRDQPDYVDTTVVNRVGTVNLRDGETLGRLGGPFDEIAHSVEVRTAPRGVLSMPPPLKTADRRVEQYDGWYGIRNVLFFLWRIASFSLTSADARKSAITPAGFHFSSLGNPAPLFTPRGQAHEDARISTEPELPGPIRPAAFYYQPEVYHPSAFQIIKVTAGGPVQVTTAELVCRDLTDWVSPAPGQVAIDVALGRIRFTDLEAPLGVKVSYAYGACAPIGGGPYERRGRTLAGVADTVAQPEVEGWTLYSVMSGGSIAAAIANWVTDGKPNAVIEVEGSATYTGNLAFASGATTLILQAKNHQRPTVLGDVAVTGSDDAGKVCMDGLLICGQLTVAGKLGALSLGHCTLVPGLGLDESGDQLHPGAASVVIGPDSAKLAFSLEACITGALRPASTVSSLTIKDSIVDAGTDRIFPAVLSGTIANLPAVAGSFEIAIGTQGPHKATINNWPGAGGTLAQAAASLQAAIRAVAPTRAFSAAVVVPVPGSNRFGVVPGIAAPVNISPATNDTTASDLKLDPASTTASRALIGDAVHPFPNLGLSVRELLVGGYPLIPAIYLQPPLANLTDVATKLEAGFMAGGALLAILASDDRLVILSADHRPLPSFASVAGDPLVYQLGLTSRPQAILALDGGAPFGPTTDLERVTLVGQAHFRELNASEVIFTEPVTTERKQSGCVRFSYLPGGSVAPRAYRCQPDLALGGVQDPNEKAALAELLIPVFKSLRYGEPAYGQLELTCLAEIRTGAENGSEMGAYSALLQPQRESNLLARLQEYLPVGRRAGIVYVT